MWWQFADKGSDIGKMIGMRLQEADPEFDLQKVSPSDLEPQLIQVYIGLD